MTSSAANPRAVSGILLAAGSFALYSSVDLILKLVAAGHPAAQVLTVNGIFAMLPIIAAAFMTGGPKRLATGRLHYQMLRSAFGTLSSFAAVFAYSRIPLVDFYAILFSGPLLVTALSAWLLKEKIDLPRWLAIGVGFGGVLFIVNPFATDAASSGPAADSWQVISGRIGSLVSVTCYAIGTLIVRRLRATESNLAFSFYGYIGTISVSWLLWRLEVSTPLDYGDIAKLVASGTMAGTASICLMTAYLRSPVSLVAPFQYTQLLWGALFGYLVFGHVPQQRLLWGALIVVISGLYLIYHELRISRRD